VIIESAQITMSGKTAKPSTPREVQCSRCGAVVPADAPLCWLCYAPVERKAGGSRGAQAAAKTKVADSTFLGETAGGFSLASLMMFVTLVCVAFGLSTIAPGVGIPLGVVLLIVWIRTAAVARLRAQRGLALNRSERMQMFLSSFGVAVLLIAATYIAGWAAFVAACFACAAASGIGGEALQMTAFALGAAAIAIPVLIGMAKIIRRRWRRDIGEPL
jgi:hypothetical protein